METKMTQEEFDAAMAYRPAVSMYTIFENAMIAIHSEYDSQVHAKLVRIRKAAYSSDFTQYSK